MAEKLDLCISDKDVGEEDASEDDGDTNYDDESAPRSSVTTPSPRFWHFSQLVEGNVYVGGGTIPKYKTRKARFHLATIIEEFDVKKRTWQQLETTGQHHPGLTAVACASFGKYLFAYGGNNHGSSLIGGKSINGVLSQLDLETFTWSQLSPETKDGPMRKDASGMVHFDKDKLAVVCGYAEPERTVIEMLRVSKKSVKLKTGGSSDTKSVFIRRRPDGNGGWTNEMHIFNIKERSWCSPDFTGQRPPPCADFTLTSIDRFRAILYSGDQGPNKVDSKTSPIYLFDFKNMHIFIPGIKGDKLPPLRFGQHVACCVGLTVNNPHLLISGGRLSVRMKPPHQDMWLLNLASWTWQEVEVPNDDVRSRLGRWGHSATTIIHSEGNEEVIIFGGSRDCYEVPWDTKKKEGYHRWADPISFIFDQQVMLRDVVFDNASQNKTNKKVTKESMRGVEVCGETCVVVTNSAQFFEWEGYGLKLHFQENSLPKHIKQITISIKASLAGHYELPENCNLVSAVYWFCCEPKCKLEKQATLELEHCAESENVSKLSFISASSTQGKLPYTFSQVEGGQFSSQSSYGVLDLHKFCGKGVCQKGCEEKEYRASVLYLKDRSPHQEVCFTVTLNLSIHLRAIEERYKTTSDAELVFYFESDKITLDIPIEGIDHPSGWKIVPLSRPMIMKKEVDKFEPKTKGIPHCKLLVRLEDPSKMKPLLYTVNLQGAKDPPNFFTVHIEDNFSATAAAAVPQASAASYIPPQADIHTGPIPNRKNLITFKWRNEKGEIKKFRIISQAVTKWKDIGYLLQIRWQQVEVWEKEKKTEECCTAVFHYWLDHPCEDYPPTWEGLGELLVDCELSQVATELKLAVNNIIM